MSNEPRACEICEKLFECHPGVGEGRPEYGKCTGFRRDRSIDRGEMDEHPDLGGGKEPLRIRDKRDGKIHEDCFECHGSYYENYREGMKDMDCIAIPREHAEIIPPEPKKEKKIVMRSCATCVTYGNSDTCDIVINPKGCGCQYWKARMGETDEQGRTGQPTPEPKNESLELADTALSEARRYRKLAEELRRDGRDHGKAKVLDLGAMNSYETAVRESVKAERTRVIGLVDQASILMEDEGVISAVAKDYGNEDISNDAIRFAMHECAGRLNEIISAIKGVS